MIGVFAPSERAQFPHSNSGFAGSVLLGIVGILALAFVLWVGIAWTCYYAFKAVMLLGSLAW